MASLDALGSDAWATLLGAARRALTHAGDGNARDDELRDAPTSRLVSGPLRAALSERLATDETLWVATVEELGPIERLDDALTALLAPEHDGAPVAPGTSDAADDRPRVELRRARHRAREARQERDTWRRRAEGAEARAQRLATERDELLERLRRAEAELERVRARLEEAGADRQRAVERERRRRGSEIAELERTIGSLRRAEQERREDLKRREEAAAAAREASRAEEAARRRAREQGPPRVVPGRPSQLPAGVAAGTTEAARALLHRGRLVLVDGYNVTKQHRGHLDLETQRTWLVQLLGTLASQRSIRPIVVFDGQASGGGRPPTGLREVEVRFTDAGITADDEVVFAVEATDEPVVVVTDDRELVARVTHSGADVIGTRSLLGLAS